MPSNLKFLVPAPGRLVRDPITGRALNPAGEWVNINNHEREIYYRRRLADGDLLQGQQPAPAAPREG